MKNPVLQQLWREPLVGHPGSACWAPRYFLLGTPVLFVGHPGSACWPPRYFLLGTPVCCGWGITGSSWARFRLVCAQYWGKRPATGRRSLLGTPVVLVGHPGSGFGARVARLKRSRDAGVAGAEPHL